MALESLTAEVPKLLEQDHALLLQQSEEFRISRTVDVRTLDEAAAHGWARMPWVNLALTVRQLSASMG